jgi:alkylation response protein AidB-like acyl-CoA dehydrogenase
LPGTTAGRAGPGSTSGACRVPVGTLSFAAVDFDLSSDQLALRDAATDLLDRWASPERVRAFVGPGVAATQDPGGSGEPSATTTTTAAGFDHELWEAMADQGWLGVERAEADGGLDLGMVEVAVLCEELGRRAAPAPFVGSILCLGALREAGADHGSSGPARSAIDEWSARLAEGTAIGCVAWGPGPTSACAATPGADGRWLLTGTPEPTQYASEADLAVVLAEDGVFAVSLDQGARPPAEPAMDPTRPLAWLRLADTPAFRIGDARAAGHLIDRAATAAAALLLGASARVLEISVEYAKVRKQFGHPIGSFQALKHRLADALVDVEGMRSATYFSAWCLSEGDPEAPLAASMAKAWCSDASRRVTATGLQVHGGIGFTWEHELHLHLKRAQLDASTFGDATWHRDRIAGLLAERLAEGRSPI